MCLEDQLQEICTELYSIVLNFNTLIVLYHVQPFYNTVQNFLQLPSRCISVAKCVGVSYGSYTFVHNPGAIILSTR